MFATEIKRLNIENTYLKNRVKELKADVRRLEDLNSSLLSSIEIYKNVYDRILLPMQVKGERDGSNTDKL